MAAAILLRLAEGGPSPRKAPGAARAFFLVSREQMAHHVQRPIAMIVPHLAKLSLEGVQDVCKGSRLPVEGLEFRVSGVGLRGSGFRL